jgi:hypothetical protein
VPSSVRSRDARKRDVAPAGDHFLENLWKQLDALLGHQQVLLEALIGAGNNFSRFFSERLLSFSRRMGLLSSTKRMLTLLPLSLPCISAARKQALDLGVAEEKSRLRMQAATYSQDGMRVPERCPYFLSSFLSSPIESNSTSKIRVAPGPMSGPAPRSP